MRINFCVSAAAAAALVTTTTAVHLHVKPAHLHNYEASIDGQGDSLDLAQTGAQWDAADYTGLAMTAIGGLFGGLGLADMFGAGREQGVDTFELVEEKNDQGIVMLEDIKGMMKELIKGHAKLEESVDHVEQTALETEHIAQETLDNEEAAKAAAAKAAADKAAQDGKHSDNLDPTDDDTSQVKAQLGAVTPIYQLKNQWKGAVDDLTMNQSTHTAASLLAQVQSHRAAAIKVKNSAAPKKGDDDAIDHWVMITNLLVNIFATVVGYFGGNLIIKKFNDADKAKGEADHAKKREEMNAKVGQEHAAAAKEAEAEHVAAVKAHDQDHAAAAALAQQYRDVAF